MDARAYEFISNPILNDPELLPAEGKPWEDGRMHEYPADDSGCEMEGDISWIRGIALGSLV